MEKYCIGLDYTIKEAIERIDMGKHRVVLVLDKDLKVVAVLSQGDIIRALCSGINLYARVSTILSSDFLYLNERNMAEAYKLFKKIKITMIPIVDEDFHLKDIITMDDIYDYLERK